ncbi:hypothetical protein ONZ45_g16334 [Pleurotus djamor]|nr:hypothetical protein ONZ45_g16334 [Pleurotus djamor]
MSLIQLHWSIFRGPLSIDHESQIVVITDRAFPILLCTRPLKSIFSDDTKFVTSHHPPLPILQSHPTPVSSIVASSAWDAVLVVVNDAKTRYVLTRTECLGSITHLPTEPNRCKEFSSPRRHLAPLKVDHKIDSSIGGLQTPGHHHSSVVDSTSDKPFPEMIRGYTFTNAFKRLGNTLEPIETGPDFPDVLRNSKITLRARSTTVRRVVPSKI